MTTNSSPLDHLIAFAITFIAGISFALIFEKSRIATKQNFVKEEVSG